MISNLNPSAEAFMANINRVQRSVDEASRQVSSGLRVNSASDAPDQVDSILQIRTDTARNTQIESNLALAKADADSADGALNSATKLLDRARTLGAQGANFTLDAAGRQSLAGEVEGLLEQMVCYQPDRRYRAATSSAGTTRTHPLTSWIWLRRPAWTG